jgi:hypothetical protein
MIKYTGLLPITCISIPIHNSTSMAHIFYYNNPLNAIVNENPSHNDKITHLIDTNIYPRNPNGKTNFE